jgi:F0F1-type ATP synthase assembly protein I
VGARDYQQVLSLSHLGVMFFMIVGGSIFLGWKVDEWLGVSPVGILLGLLIGFAGGFYYLFVTLFTSEKDDDEAPPGAKGAASDDGSDGGLNTPSE